jgi:hypothetical protein
MTICSLSVRRTMSSGSTNSAKSGRFLEQLLDPRLELHLPDHSNLEAEVTQSTAQVVLDGDGLTDIVGSTEKAAALGDSRWRDLLDKHHDTIRSNLARFRGHEVKTTGDGILATFGGSRQIALQRCKVCVARRLGVYHFLSARIAHRAFGGSIKLREWNQ